jgi:hypothetical protein
VLSVLDYFQYTGNTTLLAEYAPKVAELLTTLLSTTLANPDLHSGQPGLGFVGWDDRTGAGFSNSSCVECERDFRMILLRTANESAVAYAGVNDTLAAGLAASATKLAKALRQPTPSGADWHSELLLASASDAVNAGLTTPAEGAEIFSRVMNDSPLSTHTGRFKRSVGLARSSRRFSSSATATAV